MRPSSAIRIAGPSRGADASAMKTSEWSTEAGRAVAKPASRLPALIFMSLAAIGCGAILMGTFLIGARIANSNPQPITIEAPARLTPAPPNVQAPPKPVGAYAVTVMRAELGTFRDTVPVSGSLVPREDLVVAPEVEGLRIVEVKVEPGAHVRRGDVLAVLASDSADTGLAQSDAQLSRGRATIEQAKRQIAQLEAQQREARNALERARSLLKSGTIARATFEQRETAVATIDQQVLAAREALKQAEADLAQLQAQRRDLTWRRGRTTVQAPVDGVVSRRTARVGAIATANGEAMFNIVASDGVELEAEVSDLDLARVVIGQTARVTISGFGEAAGKVRLIAPEIDRATRLGKVRIALEGRTVLRVGAFASGEVETVVRQGVAVPASALLLAGDGASVQVVEAGRVRSRRVTTGIEDGDRVEVLNGLFAGDLVIVKAGSFLHDGDAVEGVVTDKIAAGGTP